VAQSDTGGDEEGTRERTILELQRLRHEVQKLALEVETLRSTRLWDRLVGRYLPVVTSLLAIAGFWFGAIQYYVQKGNTDKQRVEELRREAAKPFWDMQLRLYVRASEAAAAIAVTNDARLRVRAEVDFWTLYWGPLASVEDVGLFSSEEKKHPARVEAAMVAFGAHLRDHPQESRKRKELERLSLELAHAIRDEIGPSFALEAPASSNLRGYLKRSTDE
jgi:hypothetical protein